MKKNATEFLHKLTNEDVTNMIGANAEDIQIISHLNEILESKGMTQKELALRSGLRHATINEFVNMTKKNINIGHVIQIMLTLGLKELSELFEIKVEKHVPAFKFCSDCGVKITYKQYLNAGGVCESCKSKY